MGQTAARPAPGRKQPKAANVASLFLYWANREGDPVSHLKLQKLLYYSQAWHLVNFGRTLFPDPIEAWAYGPVVRSLYEKYSKEVRSSMPILYPFTKTDGTKEEKPFSKPELHYLKEFYKRFIRMSAHDLVNMSHRDEPWQVTKRNEAIDTELMRKFYTSMYRRAVKNKTTL